MVIEVIYVYGCGGGYDEGAPWQTFWFLGKMRQDLMRQPLSTPPSRRRSRRIEGRKRKAGVMVLHFQLIAPLIEIAKLKVKV